MIERLHTGHVSVWLHGFQKVILRTTSPSPSVTPLLVGEALAGRASPAVRLGSIGRKAAGPVLIGSDCRTVLYQRVLGKQS